MTKIKAEEINKITMDIWRLISKNYHKYGLNYPKLVVYMNELLYNHIESINQSLGILEHRDPTKKYQYKTIYGCKLKVVESDNEEEYYYEVR